MSAEIIPFPIARRQAFIQKQVDHAASMNPDAAARYLQYQLQVQGEALRRRGVAEDRIARELNSMGAAIHAMFTLPSSTGAK